MIGTFVMKELKSGNVCNFDFIHFLQGEDNLIFSCKGPTDPEFWEIKMIILI